MTYFLHINEKPSQEQEKKVQQPVSIVQEQSQSKECTNLRIGAIISAWITAILPSAFFFVMFWIIVGTLDYWIKHGRIDGISAAILIVFGPIILTIFIVTIANIYGVHKDKPSYTRPWMICIVLCVAFLSMTLFEDVDRRGFNSSSDSIYLIVIVVHIIAFVTEFMHFRKISKIPTVVAKNLYV